MKLDLLTKSVGAFQSSECLQESDTADTKEQVLSEDAGLHGRFLLLGRNWKMEQNHKTITAEIKSILEAQNVKCFNKIQHQNTVLI